MTLECTDCGWQPADETETCALDFDHVDPKTKTNDKNSRAFLYYWPWERILAEIAKCEPRCARCHRIRTYRERHWETRRDEQAETGTDEGQPALFDL